MQLLQRLKLHGALVLLGGRAVPFSTDTAPGRDSSHVQLLQALSQPPTPENHEWGIRDGKMDPWHEREAPGYMEIFDK